MPVERKLFKQGNCATQSVVKKNVFEILKEKTIQKEGVFSVSLESFSDHDVNARKNVNELRIRALLNYFTIFQFVYPVLCH